MDTDTRRTDSFLWLSALLLLSVSLGSNPQPAQAQLNAELGVEVGRMSTTVEGNGLWSDPNRRASWVLAGTARIPLPAPFEVEFNAAYVQKGAHEQLLTPDGSATVTMQMNYIEFPLMIGARWPIGAAIAGRMFAGPAVGFNVDAERTADHTQSDTPALRDQIRRTEVSAVLGLGIDIQINYQTVMVDAQYHRGLTEVLDEPEGDSLQHRGMSVTLGVAF